MNSATGKCWCYITLVGIWKAIPGYFCMDFSQTWVWGALPAPTELLPGECHEWYSYASWPAALPGTVKWECIIYHPETLNHNFHLSNDNNKNRYLYRESLIIIVSFVRNGIAIHELFVSQVCFENIGFKTSDSLPWTNQGRDAVIGSGESILPQKIEYVSSVCRSSCWTPWPSTCTE